MSRRRIAIVVALATLVLAAVGGAAAIFAGRGSQASPVVPSGNQGPYRGSEPPGRFPMAPFALRDERGKLVRTRDLRGRITLLTFLDSQCTESCPVIAFQVARTLDALTPEERRRVQAVAITTDPAEDTPASVHAFLRRNHATGRISYLGGGQPLATLRTVWKSFHVLSSHESGKDTLHSAPVRIYDRQGIWVATLHVGVDLTNDNLAHDVRVALGR